MNLFTLFKYSKMRVDICRHCFSEAHFNRVSHRGKGQVCQCKLLTLSTQFLLTFPKILYSF